MNFRNFLLEENGKKVKLCFRSLEIRKVCVINNINKT